MTNVTPIQQPPVEDLRNCLMIAELGVDAIRHIDHEQDAAGHFTDIARLIRHALEGLSEPNLASIQAAEILIRELNGTVESQRNLRDTVAGILNAQLTGQIPPTWEPDHEFGCTVYVGRPCICEQLRKERAVIPETPQDVCKRCGAPHVSHARTPEDELCPECRFPDLS